jgi:GntR family transcriptional regulator, hexuronate regulon transcriptional repressor
LALVNGPAAVAGQEGDHRRMRNGLARKPVKSARLYQQVAEQLARSIAAGDYKPGERLPSERELSQAHSVSRPTVREAIIALELDGLVEVRHASGVYVAKDARRQKPIAHDIGAIELTEARLLIETEVAGLAATQIGDEEVEELRAMLAEMEAANRKGASAGELVDRRFHETIGRASNNSALAQMIEQLWTIRNRSPQCVRFFERSREKGNRPNVDEHRAIVEALAARDPVAARAAMREHLTRVLNTLLDATEIEAIEEAKARIAAQRNRFSHSI